MPRRSEAQTERTRQQILARGMDIASVEGLHALTIGRLADANFMSKSGLFAHFGSKEELQLAVVGAAAEVFDREVTARTAPLPPGLDRLLRRSSAWLAYLETSPFRGGCFFAAVAAEVDDRPGRVRDLVIELARAWLNALEQDAGTAVAAGDLQPETDPAQLAFEIHAFLQAANATFQLHGDSQAFRRAGRAIRRAVDAVRSAEPDA